MPSGLLKSIWSILSKFSPLERWQTEQSEGLFLSNVFMSVCVSEKAVHLTLLPLPFFENFINRTISVKSVISPHIENLLSLHIFFEDFTNRIISKKSVTNSWEIILDFSLVYELY